MISVVSQIYQLQVWLLCQQALVVTWITRSFTCRPARSFEVSQTVYHSSGAMVCELEVVFTLVGVCVQYAALHQSL